MNKFFTVLAVLFLMVTIILLWVTQGNKAKGPVASSGEEVVTEAETGSVVGGGFSLTDHNKKERSEQDFKGKAMLVFFGFTHCPDICPVTVSTFSSLMELLGDKADQVAPIFISVDPKRDTPEVLADYLSNFDKRIIGLTGTKEQIKAAADAYKVYYSPAKKEAETDGDGAGGEGESSNTEGGAHAEHMAHGADDNYLIDHSGYIYLMDLEGKYVEHFRYDVSEQELADALKKYLK